jgi:glycosyltransferase involved in cell wall biosynthesis
MKISIAMATYNGEKYLQEQLDSFVNQTRLPDELVVCDDGSNDETISILTTFQKSVPFTVRIYENPQNLGYAKNFEKAVSLCKGDIIFLSDQDDFWFDHKIDVMAQALANNQDALVGINDTEIVDERLNPTGLLKSRQVLNLGLSINSFITGCCTVFKAEIKDLVIPVPAEYFVHDTWLHRLAILLDSRVFVDRPLQYYRRYSNNTTDWIGSSTKKVNVLDLAFLYGGKDPRLNCQHRLSALDIAKQRMELYRQDLISSSKMEIKIKDALSKLDRECAAVMKRASTLEAPRSKRLKSATMMLFTGDYNYFSGWKSFAKDLWWK